MAQITIVAENRVGLSKGLIAEHGFCVYLESGDRKILWDTGQGLALPVNAKPLGVDLKKLDAIALSHGHFDHTGGLEYALTEAGGGEVVCHPACFDRKMAEREFFGKKVEVPVGIAWTREHLEGRGARFKMTADTLELAPGVHFFAEVPMTTDYETVEPGFFLGSGPDRVRDTFKDDAALAVLTERGWSVLLGCAHRGTVNTLLHIKRRLGADRIHSVWGGTHLIERTPDQLDATIRALDDLGIQRIGTAHCTGFQNEVRLAQAFPDRFAFVHVGMKTEI